MKRAQDRPLILVAEDGFNFIMDVVKKRATGPVRHTTLDPATSLKLYREREPGSVAVKAPEPEVQFTPEETWESIKSLLSLGYHNTAYIRTTHGNDYLYMTDSEGNEKSAGKIRDDFRYYALEERTFRTRSYIYKGEVKGKNLSRVEWTREKTEWRKRHELLTP